MLDGAVIAVRELRRAFPWNDCGHSLSDLKYVHEHLSRPIMRRKNHLQANASGAEEIVLPQR